MTAENLIKLELSEHSIEAQKVVWKASQWVRWSQDRQCKVINDWAVSRDGRQCNRQSYARAYADAKEREHIKKLKQTII